ncbi:hypothetical protein L1887_30260 [Cichorium endivia]|nr:hypothetical protein L1887_30260 [Cichorium endivia]
MESDCKVDVHYHGVFTTQPLIYTEGMHHLFEDIDFAGMDLDECVKFLERFTEEKCRNLYFCLPESELGEGLKKITDEIDYVDLEDHHSGVAEDIDRLDINTPVNNTRSPPDMVDSEENQMGEHEPGEVHIGDIDRKSGVETKFNPDVEWNKQKPELGMRFESPKQLKDMLCKLWASWMSEEKSFQIKSLIHEHNCASNFKFGSIVNDAWMGSHYTNEILHNQKFTVRQLREDVKQKFGIEVNMVKCRRGKNHALSLIQGTIVEQYAKLWSYGEEIRRSNTGSNVQLGVNCIGDGKNYFSRFYVCFQGLKEGWKTGCRRLINLDGCFLKGYCSGELLSAIGRDANNQIFLIAWAVVCVENKDNWKWFMENLTEDLHLESGVGVTLMSDQHKGLLEVVKEVLTSAEHGQCARHIYASKATTKPQFKAVMKEIDHLSPGAYEHLMERDPKTWSRAFFRLDSMCDAVENGICESFNTIRHKINVLKMQQRYWQVLPSGLLQFETRKLGESYAVDLEKKTCTCRLWQLNKYSCVHSIATITYINGTIEAYVEPLYLATFYNNAYKFPLLAMNGSDMWPSTDYTPPLPPNKRTMPGRPTIKRRRRDASKKVGRHIVSKVGKGVICGICKQPGHNKKTCNQVQRPRKVRLPKRSTTKTNVDDECEVGNGGNEQEVNPSTDNGVNETEPGITLNEIEAEIGVNESIMVNEEDVIGLMTQESISIGKRKTKRSERIVKKKLAKRVQDKNGEGNTSDHPVDLD